MLFSISGILFRILSVYIEIYTTNRLHEGLSGLYYYYLHNLILLARLARLCGFFNALKGSEKENKETWCLIHQNHGWSTARREVRHTAWPPVLWYPGTFWIHQETGLWETLPEESCKFLMLAKGSYSKNFSRFQYEQAQPDQEWLCRIFSVNASFLSLFHPCKPYWFLQLLVVWPQELNNGLQLLQHLLLPKFQILYLLNS